MNEPIEILYQDDHLLVVNKPAGLLVHRSEIDRHETDFLLQRVRDQVGQRVYAVNRLDKPTSGLAVMTTASHQVEALSEALQAAAASKRYLAVVRGVLPDSGTIDKPLKRIQDAADSRSLANPDLEQPALTRFWRLEQCELPFCVDRYPTSRYSLALLELHTGRRHQLRRHLKSVSHPIIGDTSYGKGRHNRLFASEFGCGRLLLHAWALTFQPRGHPEPLRLEAPLDDAFNNTLQALGWSESVAAAKITG